MLVFKKGSYVFIFLAVSFLLPALLSAEELSHRLERSRYYREKGFEYQSLGRLDEAMICYHKAILLDPTYTVAYNDLGIVYEAKGMDEKAKEAYLAGLKTDPNYPNLYTNLAMLCEKRKEYASAGRYWKKRIELGPAGDVWVKKAEERLKALREFVPELLAEEVAEIKREEKRKRACIAKMENYFLKAMRFYWKDHLQEAKRELEKISAEITSSLKD